MRPPRSCDHEELLESRARFPASSASGDSFRARFLSDGGGDSPARRSGELHLIEVSEVVRQPERPHKQRLDRVRLLSKVVDGVLEAVAVLPYYRLAPPDFFG